jgi:hypothetical protein
MITAAAAVATWIKTSLASLSWLKPEACIRVLSYDPCASSYNRWNWKYTNLCCPTWVAS